MAKLFMTKNNSNPSKKPAPNTIGASHQILRNSVGTLKGMQGTIGGDKQSKPKGRS
jgi:hypothetical protein